MSALVSLVQKTNAQGRPGHTDSLIAQKVAITHALATAQQLRFIRCSLAPCRERASGAYGTASYFTATVAFDFVPMRVLPTALFALTTYWMVGLRPGLGRAATFLLLLVLTNLTGAAMNMAIGKALSP